MVHSIFSVHTNLLRGINMVVKKISIIYHSVIALVHQTLEVCSKKVERVKCNNFMVLCFFLHLSILTKKEVRKRG